jgi:hypothetical protein
LIERWIEEGCEGNIPPLTFMTRGKATDHWPWLLLVLLLVLLLGGIASRYGSPREKTGGPKPHPASPMTGSSGARSKMKERSASVVETDQPKSHHAGIKARVRVRPGETAVMGYYEIAPGHFGLTVVTPEAREDGTVSVQIRSVELPDSAAVRSEAREFLPDIFELERSGAVSQARLNELMRLVASDERMKSLMYPRMITRPGQPCIIRNVVTAPGAESLGTTYAVQADAIPGAEGYDVSVDYHHNGTRSEE